MKTPVLVLALLVASPALAAIHTEAIDYKDGNATLSGYLAYDDALSGKQPGVLVIHDWLGMAAYAKRRAEMLAKLGYVAFAGDMYGKGITAKNHDEAGKLAGVYLADRAAMRRRVQEGLAVLKSRPNVDASRVAAIGYCFGGTSVLELARAGAELQGVISFHGGLTTPHPEDTKSLKPKVLVEQGADDQWTMPGLPAFEDEMKKAGANYQVDIYGGAVHGFTVKDNGDDPKTGLAYNAQADRRSWQAMKDFFAEIFH